MTEMTIITGNTVALLEEGFTYVWYESLYSIPRNKLIQKDNWLEKITVY